MAIACWSYIYTPAASVIVWCFVCCMHRYGVHLVLRSYNTWYAAVVPRTCVLGPVTMQETPRRVHDEPDVVHTYMFREIIL